MAPAPRSSEYYIPCVRDIVRKDPRFFVLATFAAVGLRLVFLFRFPALTPDSFVYGDIAKNWLQHGIYGLSGQYQVTPTYIRLPGYPAFLAAVFAVFGMEHYRAALVLQMFVDIGTCFVIADLTCRLVSTRGAKAAFLLAALCPFLANYTAAVLTETLEVFFTVLAVDFVIAGLNVIDTAAGWPWLGCGLATAAAILLRPDGGLLLAAIGIYLTLSDMFVGRPNTEEKLCWLGAARRFDHFGRVAAAPHTLDVAQSSYPAPLRTACPALCQRAQCLRAHGIQSLGQDLDGGLCIA
jgi:hypothetical protein